MSNYVSIGQIAGAVVGAVIGYYVGGFYGAWVGASVGYSLGTIVDPITADIKTPGVPAQPFQVTPNTVGTILPDGLGTLKIVGFLLAYGKERTEAIKEKQPGGKGGEAKKKQTVGYRYYADWVLGICLGPVDAVYTIFKDEKEVWSGEVNRPGSDGQVSISIDDFGPVDFYFGTDDQVANGDVGDLIGNDSLNSPMNGLCWAYFKKCYIGEFNRLPTMTFVVRRSPTIALLPDNTVIRGIDYNPMHAIWYILHHMTGLPETWLHTDDFKTVAATLNNYIDQEERGIAILFDQQQPAVAYLENINTHIDGILRYGSDGKFHPKLMRNDYNVATLPLVDESIMLDKPTLSRKSWIDTINELTVQYSRIDREFYRGTFIPFAMATDGAYLYIVGQAHIHPAYYLRIEKRSMTGQLLDQVDVAQMAGATTYPGTWKEIVVDSTSIYIGGYTGITATHCQGIVQRRNKFDLADLRWTHTYHLGGATNYTVLDIDQDNLTGDIFFIGDDTGGIAAHYGRLLKADGSVLWFFSRDNPDRGAGRGIASSHDPLTPWVYASKKNGYVEKLDAATGASIMSVQTSTRCYLKVRTYLDLWLIEHLYLVGYSLPAGLGDVGETAIVTRKHATTLAAQWEMTHGPDIPLEENMYEGIAIDDFNVYVVGRAPYYPGATARARMAKYFLDDPGTMLWERDNEIATRQATAICHYGTYIYVAGWDSAKASLYYLERRSKADGRIT